MQQSRIKSKAVVLFSGGLKSTLVLDIALKRQDNIIALQLRDDNSNRQEHQAAAAIMAHYRERDIKIDWRAIDVSDVWCNWLENKPWPLLPLKDNVGFYHMAVLAATITALHDNAEKVYLGITKINNLSVEAFNILGSIVICMSDKRVTFDTPLLGLSVTDIVHLSLVDKIPFDLSWSCYTDNKVRCLECAGCKNRARGFGSLVSDVDEFGVYSYDPEVLNKLRTLLPTETERK